MITGVVCGARSIDVKSQRIEYRKSVETRDFRESGLVRGQVSVPGFYRFMGKWKLVYYEKWWRVE